MRLTSTPNGPNGSLARRGVLHHRRVVKQGLSRRRTEFAEALDRDPASRKRMVRCVGCDRVGLRAETPDRFWNSPWLEQLDRLPVDERGLCEQCATAYDSTPRNL